MAYVIGKVLCPCGELAVMMSKSVPACAGCVAIEREQDLKSLAHGQWSTDEDIAKTRTRYAEDKWACKLAIRLGIRKEPPPDALVTISGWGHYAVLTNQKVITL